MNVAIVGASGAVGQEFLKVLEERNFPVDDLLLFGSERSEGRKYGFKGKEYEVRRLRKGDGFKGVDIAFVSAGASVSREYAETITKHGAVMIDNSSAFRLDDEVPLVVPECNAKDALVRPKGIIANPNCTTIMMAVALKPIEELSHIKSVRVASYQSASGAGAKAMAELEGQYADLVAGKKPTVEKFPYQLAYNLIPQIDTFISDGYTREEYKMYAETRKIMHSDIRCSATCVRVSALRSHSEAIWCETERPLGVEEVRAAMNSAKGVVLRDDPATLTYPMPLYTAGRDEVFVGRIRKDIACENGISFWLSADQIRKGAALNAVQIAEYLISHHTTEFKVCVATEEHTKFAQTICDEIYISSQERKTGIAKRTPEYIIGKIRAGKAVVAVSDTGEFAGFSYIESWGGKSFVANSGLIVAHKFRGLGLARKIKEQTFILSRTLFPDAKIFSITTGAAVMKMNYEFGFRPVPFSELTDDPEFWKGCEGCRHFDILTSHDYRMCICTGLLYDPKEHLTIHHPDDRQ